MSIPDEWERPKDIAAERAALGAMILSPRAAAEVAELVARDDFHDPRHQVVYGRITSMRSAGTPVDAETLRIELEKTGEFSAALHPVYLHDLMEACPTATNAAVYARTVAEVAGRRRILDALLRAQQRAWSQTADLAEIVSATVEELSIEGRLADLGRQDDEPALVLLDEFLATEDEPVRYRVDGLWPIGGRVVLAAQFKAGKTTLRDNLVRALADKERFLDRFEVDPPDGRVVIIDNELDARMLRRWLRDQGIVNTDRVAVLPLRGKVGSFDLLDSATRARWATKLRQVDARVIVFDCLRPVLDALGLDESKEAGRFLVSFDALLDEAGASEAVLVHHMGHQGERSRGDSRLVDWPDVTWRLVRERGEDGEVQPDARRYFSAYGRDVDVPEGLLTFDRDRRRLVLAGGTRRETAADAVIPDILDYLAANPGASGRAIETALTPSHKRADIRTALRRAIDAEQIDTSEGPRRATLHFLNTPECASAPSAP